MDFVVYDHRVDKNGIGAYSFYEQSAGITQALKDEIRQFAPHDSGDASVTDMCTTRFAPTVDGKNYMLSHIFQNNRSMVDRAHYAIVSYVLNPKEADELFALPYSQIQTLTEFSRSILDKKSTAKKETWETVMDFCAPAKAGKGAQSAEYAPAKNETKLALYQGAMLDSKTQLYMIPGRTEWLTWLLQILPRRLRKDVSFCVDAFDVRETYRVSLVFCSAASFQRMQGQSGGEPVSRIVYREDAGLDRPLFVSKSNADAAAEFGEDERALTYVREYAELLNIENWDLYRQFVDAVSQESREAVLQVISPKDLNYIFKNGGRTEAVMWLYRLMTESDKSAPAAKRGQDAPTPSNSDDYEEDAGIVAKIVGLFSRGDVLSRGLCLLMVLLFAFAMFKLAPFTIKEESVTYYVSVGSAPSGATESGGGQETAQSGEPAKPADGGASGTKEEPADDVGASGTENVADDGASGTENVADGGASGTENVADGGASGTGDGASEAENVADNAAQDSGRTSSDNAPTAVPVGATVYTFQIESGPVVKWCNAFLMASLLWGLVLFLRLALRRR